MIGVTLQRTQDTNRSEHRLPDAMYFYESLNEEAEKSWHVYSDSTWIRGLGTDNCPTNTAGTGLGSWSSFSSQQCIWRF